eukprot:TRINITY_DN5163_c0_g1_i5.p1 TRINITY_DN5163_c0_g1~~TRINITY_DN5163_c0_g1_i5.p1  ORF type:complete len:531 (-),score=136.43 TRINITY_DN5163_c0_g1_i5:207-1799(-)
MMQSILKRNFFFSSRRRHTRSCLVSWARRCVQETGGINAEYMGIPNQTADIQNNMGSINHQLPLSLLLIAFISFSGHAEEPPTNNRELRLIIHVFRHGARAPIDMPFGHELWTDQPLGELTSVGMRAHFLLGNEIRRRYVDTAKFLPPNYDSKVLNVRSTNFNRTIMSALSYLQGLYPIGSGPNLPTNMSPELAKPPINLTGPVPNVNEGAVPNKVQVIPVHTSILEQDNILGGDWPERCPAILDFYNSNHNTQKMKDANAYVESTLRELENKLQMPFRSIPNIKEAEKVIDTLISNKFMNFQAFIPYDDPIWSNLTYIYTLAEVAYAYLEDDQITLASSQLNGEIKRLLLAKKNGQYKDLKLQVLSGHDVTLESLLFSWGFKSYQCLFDNFKNNVIDEDNCIMHPVYCSNMIIELSEDVKEQKWYVKAKYDDRELSLCKDGKKSCELDTFVNNVLNKRIMSLNDFDKKCFANTRPHPLKWYFIVGGALGSLLLISLIANCYCYRRYKRDNIELGTTLYQISLYISSIYI